jgi:bacterioferritin
MQGDAQVIEILNEALTAELTAVNQYFVGAKMAANWGYERLAKEWYDESIGEMRHAETLIERILLLDAVPNMQRLFPVNVGESVIEQYRLNFEMEKAAVERYRRGIVICDAQGDPGTRVLLERFLADEEEHVDEGEAALTLYDQLGEQLWLARWAG